MHRILCQMAALPLLSAPAFAGTFTPDEGCTPWLTIQTRSCSVANYYTCEKDAPGDNRRIEFGINGAYYYGRVDYEAQWVESHLDDGSVELLLPNPTDAANFSELLETGYDSFDFSVMNDKSGQINFKGYDTLTSEAVIIDGVSLKQTKYSVEARSANGTLLWRADGHEYIHPEWRIFLSGIGRVDDGAGYVPNDFTPVDFIFPGEDGFMGTIPKYECEMLNAVAPNFKTNELINDL